MAFKIIDGRPIDSAYIKAGSGGLTAGGLVVASGSGVAMVGIKATAAFGTQAVLIGIARSTVASGSYTYVDFVEGHIVEADFTGSSKTTVADTDNLASFDVSDESTVNLDDTTGGCFVALGGPSGYNYNNTNLKIKGKFLQACILA